MTRWLILSLTLALSLFLLWGVRRYQPDLRIFDEESAYEVTPGRPIRVRIGGGIQEAIMTSWAAMDPSGRFDPRRTFRYTLEVALESASRTLLSQAEFPVLTRMTNDPGKPLALGDYTARLAESADWLADARTQHVDTTPLGANGGFAVVKLRSADPNQRALIRLSYLEPLGALERAVRLKTIRPERGRRMVEGRSGLGFEDLPAWIRERALASFERRLPAVGRDGIDYLARTILIGNRISSPPIDDVALEGHAIGPARVAAFNFKAPLRLRVHGEPDTELEVHDASLPPYEAIIGGNGEIDLEFGSTAARTVSIAATQETRVRFSVALVDADAQIGFLERAFEEQRLFITPDVRIQRAWQLDPELPVVIGVAPGQTLLGLTLRAFVEPEARTGRVRIAVRGERGTAFEREPFEAELEASLFDAAGERCLTETRHALVTLPPGVEAVALVGSPETLVTPFVAEPGVVVNRVEEEYDLPLAEGDVWRHAPSLERTTAAIRAENDRDLDRQGRVARVESVVRLEPLRAAGIGILERVAKPVSAPLARFAWMPVTLPSVGPTTELWTMLRAGESVALQVRPARSADEWFSVLYRVMPDSLGEPLVLEVDGQPLLEEVIASGSGRLQAYVSPGRHRVAVRGPEDALLFASAPSIAGGRTFKRQLVYELGPGRPINLKFDRGSDELLALFVSAVREAGPGPFKLRYTIDPGKPEREQTRLLHRVTVGSGTAIVQALESERALISEFERPLARGPLPHAIGRLRIELGDDLEPGAHLLRLEVPPGAGSGGKLWVRAVVAGKTMTEPANREAAQ